MKTMTDMWRASRQCGYNEADRTAIKRLRRAMSVALVMFLGMNTLMSMHYGGVLGAAIATLTGVGFAAILVIAGMMATRAGDEFRRALLMQSLLWGHGHHDGADVRWRLRGGFCRVAMAHTVAGGAGMPGGYDSAGQADRVSQQDAEQRGAAAAGNDLASGKLGVASVFGQMQINRE